jgi:hypothetical protein
VAQLRHEIQSIHANGAELVIVGNGTRPFAAAFREALELESPLYLDTSGASYRALGMRRGIARTLGSWRTWVNLTRALLEGARQKRLRLIVRWWQQSVPVLIPGARGDAWQLGGVLVVLPDGRIAYRYLSAIGGDHPPVCDVMAALVATRR